MMQNIDCELEPQVQLRSGLRSQGGRKGISLLPDVGAAWEFILTLVINWVHEVEQPLSACFWPDNIRDGLLPLIAVTARSGGCAWCGVVCVLSMGSLCQKSRRDGRNPPPGAFKQFPLHLSRAWRRQHSENAAELRPLEKG